MMWDLEIVAECCAGALREESRRLTLEQSPTGIDALDELAIHPILAKGLEAAGFGVLREQRYPSFAAYRRHSEGDRCDLVVTPTPDQYLKDPLLEGTLFPDDGIEPIDALWLEVKCVHQFAILNGVARNDTGYSTLLSGPVMRDVMKLSREDGIAWACLLLILFTVDKATAAHDLAKWYEQCIEKGLPIAAPIVRSNALPDHLGNGWCMAGVVRVQTL